MNAELYYFLFLILVNSSSYFKIFSYKIFILYSWFWFMQKTGNRSNNLQVKHQKLWISFFSNPRKSNQQNLYFHSLQLRNPKRAHCGDWGGPIVGKKRKNGGRKKKILIDCLLSLNNHLSRLILFRA